MFKAVLLVAGFSVVTRFFGFLFKIYLGRELGAEMLGIYQVAFSVFMVLSVLVSSGLPLAVSKYTATQRALKNAKAEYSVATSALIIGLIVSVVICVVLFFGQNLFGKLFTDFRCMEILLTLLPAVIASAVYSAFRGSLWGRQDYFSVCWTELAEQILRILFFFVMAFWLFKSTDGATIAGWSLSIACICSALLVTIVYFKKGGKITKTNGYIKAVLKSSVPVTGVRTATSLIQPVIAVLFPLMLVLSGVPNESALALYGVIMGMTFPLLFLPSTIVGALSFTLIPELSSAIAKDQKELVENRVKSAIVFAVLISALFIPFYVGLGAEIGKLIFDNELSGIFLSKAAWIMIPLGLSNITSSILNAFNLEVKSFINNILGGVVLLVFVICCSSFMQANALIWGFGLCMTLTTTLNIIKIAKHTKIKFNILKPLLLMLLFIIPAALLGKWGYNLSMFVFPSLISMCIGAVLSIGSFALLCVCFKLVDIVSIFSKFDYKPRILKFKKHKK